MAATNASKRWFLVGALSLALGVFLLILLPISGCRRGAESRRPAGAPALDVDSPKLLRTRVVATLDAPLHPGTNLIWCASFQLAWKEFATALKEKQPVVEGAETLCGQLNDAPDPRPFLPNAGYYAAAGNVADGIVARIHRDMRNKFPATPLPDFGPLTPKDLVAYGYLEADVAFAIPYFNNERPAAFRETGGKEVNVKSFGIHQEGRHLKNHSTPWRLMEQVEVLFGKSLRFRQDDSGEFAVDPYKQSPEVQLIVACVKPQATLAATLERVRSRVVETREGIEGRAPEAQFLESQDTLLIPEMDWRILHRFAELEMHLLANSVREGDGIIMAMQGIAFRLDRGGTSLRSEAKLVVRAAASVSAPPTSILPSRSLSS